MPLGLDSTSSDASTLQLKVFHDGQSMTLSDAMQHRPSAVYMEKIRNSLDLTVAYKPDGHGSRDGWHTYRSGKTEHEKQKEALPPLETANSNRASNRTSRRSTPNSGLSGRQASRRSYLIKRGDLPARSFDGAGSSVQEAPRAPPIRWQFAGGPPPRLPPMKSPAAARAGAAHRRVSTPSWESPLPGGGGFRSRRARNALQEQERAVQANPDPDPDPNPNPNLEAVVLDELVQIDREQLEGDALVRVRVRIRVRVSVNPNRKPILILTRTLTLTRCARGASRCSRAPPVRARV